MLTPDHQGCPHAKTPLAGILSRPRSHERLFRRLGEVYEAASRNEGFRPSFGDSEAMTVAEFSRRYLETRDDLALRELRGEALNAREEVMLAALNLQLEEILPKSPPLPPDVRAAMAEVKRLRRR
jgi:hypothetical protein